MFSYQDLFANRKRNFDNTAVNNESSKMSMSTKTPKLSQFDIADTVKPSDFRIRCGVQEYNVQRWQDVFFVQACPAGTKELPKKNSFHYASRPLKTEEEILKRQDSKAGQKSQKSSSNSSKKPTMSLIKKRSPPPSKTKPVLKKNRFLLAKRQSSHTTSSCNKTEVTSVARKRSRSATSRSSTTSSSSTTLVDSTTSSGSKQESPAVTNVSNHTRSCAAKPYSSLDKGNKGSQSKTNKTTTTNKRPVNLSSDEKSTISVPTKVAKIMKSNTNAGYTNTEMSKTVNKTIKEPKDALSQSMLETTQSIKKMKNDCSTTVKSRAASEDNGVKSILKEHPNVKKISKDILNVVSQGIKRNISNIHKNITLLNDTKSNAKTSALSSEDGSKAVVKEDKNAIAKRREFLAKVNQAIRLQKVFIIGSQGKIARTYIPVRNALRARGWIDKFD
uniref:Uncharacterized protein n=1 Tax=Graphocephala atropunctata TaxID=36148 RepID=A0A1B6KUD4_9HEMI